MKSEKSCAFSPRVGHILARSAICSSLFASSTGVAGCVATSTVSGHAPQRSVEARPHSTARPIYVTRNGVEGPIYWLDEFALRPPEGLFVGASECVMLTSHTRIYLECPQTRFSLSLTGCYPHTSDPTAPPAVHIGVALPDDPSATLWVECDQARFPLGPRQ